MAKFIRALAGERGDIRIVAADMLDIVDEISIKLGYPLNVSQTYGRALIASFLMSKLQKEGKLSLNYNCIDAPIEQMSFVAGSGVLKGAIIKADDMQILEYTNAEDMLGVGTLTVNTEADNGAVFTSSSELQSADIAREIAAYFQYSEQKPSVVVLGVRHDGRVLEAAGGIIIQLLPNPAESEIEQLERVLPKLSDFSRLLAENEDLETVLKALLEPELSFDIMEKEEFDYHCDCSRQKLEKALLGLGSDELKNIMEEDKKADLHCNFCNSIYHFSAEDLQALIDELERVK